MPKRHLRLAGRSSSAAGSTAPSWAADRDDVITLLHESEIDSCGLIPWGSNYTFLILMEHPTEGHSYAIYKPRRGETPLYDFPEGSLFQRERAAFVVSQALNWGLVPPTIIRDGPHGVGMVQLFIDADTNSHYLTFGAEVPDMARRVALFDCVINNTDRKAGHLLRGCDGRVWAIDHGLTFHSAPKLRTVIWDFAGEPLPCSLAQDLGRLRDLADGFDGDLAELRSLLNGRERDAMRRRIDVLLASGTFPHPVSYRSMPWPAV